MIDFDLLGAPFDWVMSIEVGEHIPAEYMLTFVGNIYIIVRLDQYNHNTMDSIKNRIFFYDFELTVCCMLLPWPFICTISKESPIKENLYNNNRIEEILVT